MDFGELLGNEIKIGIGRQVEESLGTLQRTLKTNSDVCIDKMNERIRVLLIEFIWNAACKMCDSIEMKELNGEITIKLKVKKE